MRESAVIVATDRQLNDLVKFCTNENQVGIMTVDHTFSLGDFDVTSNHPVFIGPVMIHYKKSYLFFGSSLIGMKPELKQLKCFGTDGGELYEAFKGIFPGVVHLLCSLHMKCNIKAKLCELGAGEKLQQIVIDDKSGKQISDEEVEGLLDCEDEKEYVAVFKKCCGTSGKTWISMMEDLRMHAFTRWMRQYKSALMKTTINPLDVKPD